MILWRVREVNTDKMFRKVELILSATISSKKHILFHILMPQNFRYLCFIFVFILNIGIHTYEIRVQLVTGDMPARSKFNQMIRYNGFYACSCCKFPERRCRCSKHTVYTWNDFFEKAPRLRTRSNINEHCLNLALNCTPKSRFRVVGDSPLSSIISIPNQSNMDYFYLVLEVHFR